MGNDYALSLQLTTLFYMAWVALGMADSQAEFDQMMDEHDQLFGLLRDRVLSAQGMDELLTLCQD